MNLLRSSVNALLVLLIMTLGTVVIYVIVHVAGGQLNPGNSNTPNATVPGPPAYK